MPFQLQARQLVIASLAAGCKRLVRLRCHEADPEK
jgi:hypothetical protein